MATPRLTPMQDGQDLDFFCTVPIILEQIDLKKKKGFLYFVFYAHLYPTLHRFRPLLEICYNMRLRHTPMQGMKGGTMILLLYLTS
jgi:hypothetical protein